MKKLLLICILVTSCNLIYSQDVPFLRINKSKNCKPSLNLALTTSSPGKDRPVTWDPKAIWNSYTCRVYLDYLIDGNTKTATIYHYRFPPSHVFPTGGEYQFSLLVQNHKLNLPSGVPVANFTKARIEFTKETVHWIPAIPGANDQEVILFHDIRSKDIDVDWCAAPIGNGDADADGDGVPDSKDKCPGFDDTIDTDGDGIPDGCDTNAKPNLTLSKLTIKVGSTTYNVLGNTKNIPVFKHGKNHTFNVTIKNDDAGLASSSKFKLLVSEENKYPKIGNKPVYEFRTINGSSIEGNSEKTTILNEYIYNNISNLNLKKDKTYYMFIDIDPDNNVDESNENINDNIKVIQFKYKKTPTGKILIKSPGISIPIEYDYLSTTNNLKIIKLRDGKIIHNSNIKRQNATVRVSLTSREFYSVLINNRVIKTIGLPGR